MALGSKEERRFFYRSVFSLVLPMALQNLINVAVTSADVLMLGSVGEIVLSASSLAGQVQFVMTLIFFGLTSGAAVLTAQYWGKGDTKTIEKVIGIAMRFSVLVALLFTVVVELFPAQVMSIFTAEQPVIDEGGKVLADCGNFLPFDLGDNGLPQHYEERGEGYHINRRLPLLPCL